ncbi:lipid II flippase MurJ [Microbacterium sp. NPDC056057]|uniref:lipid II flippase MurJ n=1 Tax=Microbacterium sp. NPDC056057 TaxID=3345699 RepID=UPI0035D8C943
MRKGFISLFAGNLFGKIIGAVRELILAALFGTSTPVAAFRIASTATFVPVNLFTADALSIGFLPNHSRFLLEDRRRAVVFYRAVAALVLALSVAVAVLLLATRDWWVSVIAPGVEGSPSSLAAAMLGIMALAVPFYVHANLASFLEISHGGYLLASARPTVQSLGLIAGTVAAFYLGEPLFLAAGFTSAYVIFSVWASIRVHRRGYARDPLGRSMLSRADASEAWGVFIRTITPVLWLPVIVQGAWVGERAITSLLGAEHIAALDYARFITETAMALIAAPLGLLLLASLAIQTPAEARATSRLLSERILTVCVPLSACLAAASPLVISVVFGRGAFGAESVAITTSFLMGMSVGLWAQVLAYAQVKALNSRRRNAEAALVIASGSATMIIADLLLVGPLGALGIGLGVSIGALVQAALATWRLGISRPMVARVLLLSPVFLAALWGASATSSGQDPAEWLLPSLAVTLISLAWVLLIPRLRADLAALVKRA